MKLKKIWLNKPISLFILKAILVYGLLSFSFSVFDSAYGAFYRACCNKLFAKIDENGFVRLKAIKGEYDTQMNIGNYTQADAKNNTTLAVRKVNSYYNGYLPTALLISLISATPLPLKRKGITLLVGFVLLTCFVMFKQWLLLIEICQNAKWLQLYNLNSTEQKTLDFLYPKLIPYLGTSWFFVVVIWLLVSFRKDDLKILER